MSWLLIIWSVCVFSREGRARYLWTWLRGWRSSSAPTWVTSAWEEQSHPKSLKMAKSVCGAVSDSQQIRLNTLRNVLVSKTFNYKRFLRWINQNRELCAELLGWMNFGLCCRDFWWRQMWRARSEWSATCRAAQVRRLKKRFSEPPGGVYGGFSQLVPSTQTHLTTDVSEWMHWNCGLSRISSGKEKMKHRMFSSELEDWKSVDARRRLSSWRPILLV